MCLLYVFVTFMSYSLVKQRSDLHNIFANIRLANHNCFNFWENPRNMGLATP